MAARAMWKGVLELEGDELPFKLYAAAQDARVHFRLLHEKDGVPVARELVHPGSGEVVEAAQALRGVEVERGRYVVLHEEERSSLVPAPSRSVRVASFVPRAAVDPRWIERPYWLGPDGEAGRYAALVRALEESGRVGIARWTMRSRRYAGGLLALRERLLTLRPPAEALAPADLEAPRGDALDAKELRLARQLVEALAAPFDPAEHRDEHRERVEELVRSKLRGAKPAKARRPRLVKTSDEALVAALERSLRKAG